MPDTLPTDATQPIAMTAIERKPVSHEDMSRLIKMGWWLLAGAFALGIWVATIQIQQLQVPENEHAIIAVNAELDAMERWKIEVDATRYTQNDRHTDDRAETARQLLQEKRLQRLEDTQARIEETLDEIAATLKQRYQPN
tara:strand:- start:45977 stop:46396 length:420 start_codon:yes stop_codon:yes gene_type:complete